MDVEFIRHVRQAGSAVRSRKLEVLGGSPLADDLQPLIVQRLQRPIDQCSAVLVGDTLRKVIVDAIDGMGAGAVDRDTNQWRQYIYLKEYVVNGKQMGVVATDQLSVGRSTFYDIGKQAMQALSVVLWHRVQEAAGTRNVLHNLGRPPYMEFVPRYDEDNCNYIDDVIIPALRKRWWIIAIRGEAGVGKSSLAYAAAQRCVELSEQRVLPFDAVIYIPCRREEYEPGRDRVRIHIDPPSMELVLNTVGAVLGNRQMQHLDEREKMRLVREEFGQHSCLLVFDNVDSEYATEGFLDALRAFITDLPEPQKVILTQRTHQQWEGQHTVTLKRMSNAEAEQMLRREATLRFLPMLTGEEFQLILERTGGNPLAMKQAMGVMRVLGFSADAAANFTHYSPEMLKFMYDKAYQRLPLNAKKALVLMPLFVEDVSAEALQAGAGLSGPESMGALGVLYRSCLVEKTSGAERYVIVPLLREFLRELRRNDAATIGNLHVSTFIQQAYDRIAAYYCGLLDQFRDDISSSMVLFKADRGNIMNMLEQCYSEGDYDVAIAIFELVGPLLGRMLQLSERRRWAEKIIAVLEQRGEGERAEMVRVRDLAWTLVRLGPANAEDEGKRLLTASIRRAEENDWPQVLALALRNLGVVESEQGNYAAARGSLERALALWAELGEGRWPRYGRVYLAQALIGLGEIDEGLEMLQAALNEHVEARDIDGQIEAAGSMALAYALKGEAGEARRLGQHALQLAGTITDPSLVLAESLRQASIVEDLCGDPAAALKHEDEAWRIYRRAGMQRQALQARKRARQLRRRVRNASRPAVHQEELEL